MISTPQEVKTAEDINKLCQRQKLYQHLMEQQKKNGDQISLPPLTLRPRSETFYRIYKQVEADAFAGKDYSSYELEMVDITRVSEIRDEFIALGYSVNIKPNGHKHQLKISWDIPNYNDWTN